jgi:hypothetical protein
LSIDISSQISQFLVRLLFLFECFVEEAIQETSQVFDVEHSASKPDGAFIAPTMLNGWLK